jgi:hypothetical protein
MPDDKSPENIYPCPRCGSTTPAARETEEHILEDGTERRVTFCTACVRTDADGMLRYEVIHEEFIRTEIDQKMHDNTRTE